MSCKCKGLQSGGPSPWKCDICGREWTLLDVWRMTGESDRLLVAFEQSEQFLGRRWTWMGGWEIDVRPDPEGG